MALGYVLVDRLADAGLEVVEDASLYSCWDAPEAHREAVPSFLAG